MKLFYPFLKNTYEYEKISSKSGEKISINELVIRFQENPSDLLMNTALDEYLQIKITPLNEEGENNSMIQFIEVTNSI